MALLRSEFFFEIDNLLVEDSVLGASIEFQRESYRIRVCLPTADGEFPGFEAGDFKAVGASLKNAYGHPISQVLILQLAVIGDGPTSSADFEHADGSVEGAIENGIDHLESTFALADVAAAELIDWIRIQGQPWLALHGERPKSLEWGALYDETTGRVLPVGFRGARSRNFPVQAALNRKAFTSLAHLADDQGPALPVPETLLADALHFVAGETPDFARAVLIAAIACEVKIKETLRKLAAPEMLPVLDLLLENPRDWSMAAASLFDKALKAVTGHSLRISNKNLFKHIEHLFTLRNRIAHRGEKPSKNDVEIVIGAATGVFRWLNMSLGTNSS
jgi:hypothetical protein